MIDLKNLELRLEMVKKLANDNYISELCDILHDVVEQFSHDEQLGFVKGTEK